MGQLYPAMTTLPASAMRREQGAVFKLLEEGAVLLTHHGRAAGVLVHPKQWNQLLEELEDLADSVAALQAQVELLRGEDETVSLDALEEALGGVPA